MRWSSVATLANADVLRYLGYGGQELTPELAARIEEAIIRCGALARPAQIWRSFEPEDLSLPGKSIAKHLDGAIEVVLMAVTIGHDIDRELRKLSFTDPLGQVVFDAAATAEVEQLADATEAMIRQEAARRGLYCGWRYSPGYGDLPLDVQADVLVRLNAARRLGITLTESNLMVPTKSVTAILGIHLNPREGMGVSCEECSFCDGCADAYTDHRCGNR